MGVLYVSMEAQELIQRGDVFANDFAEYTVVSVRSADRVEVENLAGMTDYMTARELIEVSTV